jgi:hypothetical protein
MGHADGTVAKEILRVIGKFEKDGAVPLAEVENCHATWFVQRLRNFAAPRMSNLVARAFHPDITKGSLEDQSTNILAVFLSIASYLESKVQCSIADIVDHLVRSRMLREGLDLDMVRIQAVFACLGHLTMVYRASLTPEDGTIQLFSSSTHISQASPRRRRRAAAGAQLKCKIDDDTREQPLAYLYSRFGELIPTPLPNQPIKASDPLYADLLVDTTLSFYTLTKVAFIGIRWVDSIGLHLEFDSRSSVLSLFRFPSFCAALCWNENADRTFLSE